MEDILYYVKKKGSFEWTLVNKILIDLKEYVSAKYYENFKTYGDLYKEFQKEINQHYNTEFGPIFFEDFDRAVTPIVLSVLKDSGYGYYHFMDPIQSYTNEYFVYNCKKFYHLTQEELHINPKFLLKTSNPYEKTIKLIRTLTSAYSFDEMHEIIYEAFNNLYAETAKVTSVLLTGDDITDIIVYIVLKAAPQNFVPTVYTFCNHLPQQQMQGEVGYYAMGLNMAITVICTMNESYSKKDATLESSTLLENRYVVPQIQMYQDLITTKENPDPDRPFIVDQSDVTITGYRYLCCLTYSYQQSQTIKTVVIKCAECVSDCVHSIRCSVLRLNPTQILYRAAEFDRQITGLKNPLFYTVQIEQGTLALLKSIDSISHYNQSLSFLDPQQNVFTLEQLQHIALLHSFGCVTLVPPANVQKIVGSQQIEVVYVEKLEENYAAFQTAYSLDFDYDGKNLSLLFPLRVALMLFQITSDQLPGDDVQISFDKFMSLVDYQQLSPQTLSAIKKLFTFVPSVDVQEIIMTNDRLPATLYDKYIGQFVRFLSYKGPGTLPYFDEIVDDYKVFTPFIVQILFEFLDFIMLCFYSLTNVTVDILNKDSLRKYMLRIIEFYVENGLNGSGVFDNLTLEQIIGAVYKKTIYSLCVVSNQSGNKKLIEYHVAE